MSQPQYPPRNLLRSWSESTISKMRPRVVPGSTSTYCDKIEKAMPFIVTQLPDSLLYVIRNGPRDVSRTGIADSPTSCAVGHFTAPPPNLQSCQNNSPITRPFTPTPSV